MRVATEREVKLEAPAGYVLPELQGEPLERRVFTSTYYDTPDGSLARSRITLRRRVENGAALWQLKLPTDGARLEIEEPGGPVAPPGSIGRLLVAHLRSGPLEPVAELRTIRNGVLVDSGSAEVVVDEVTVMDGSRAAGAFTEIEVELHEGGTDRLDAIARRLRRAGARKGDGRPKLMRVLGDPRSSTPKQTEPLLEYLAEQLGQMLAHDPGTRLGADPEDLHDFRVAVRRLRALLRAAGGAVDPEQSEPLRAELRWLGGILGAVRDLDVIIDHLRDEVARLDEAERSAADGLLGSLGQERSRARRTMLKALGSPRYLALLDSLERASHELSVDGIPSLPKVARGDFRKLRRDAKAIGADPPDEQLHELRKRAKRARYAAEFAGGKRSRNFVAAAKQFQDVLGDHQDAVVLEERLRGMLDPDSTAVRGVVVGRLIEREDQRRRAARAAWPDAWRTLERSGRRAFA